MHLNEYQNAAQEFAVYPKSQGIMYTALALNEEAGEYAGKIAKAVRKGVDPDYEAAAKELGDTLWQLSQAAREIGYTLEDIALMNLDKLYARQQAGTIIGSGDNR
jgi:NTP pyrophosphatase (non-canonical NTP hydrolase)